MGSRSRNLFRTVACVAGALLLVGIAAAAMPLVGLQPVKNWWTRPAHDSEAACAGEKRPPAELVSGEKATLRLVPEVVQCLGVETEVVEAATQPRKLELAGSLAPDVNHLARVHARFPGEVVEIGHLEGVSESFPSAGTVPRPVRYGDRVTKGQLLAVVWNTDLGNKKSELVDALSQLRVDQEKLQGIQEVYEKGTIPEAQFRQAQRNVDGDRNRVAAAERTLRVWRVPEEEIAAVKEEARRIAELKGRRDPEKERAWAQVDVRAPFEGVIVEKNVAVGDIVDTSADLFKIANLDQLTVWAQLFEEDLPALHALTPEQRRWKVSLPSEPNAPPLVGTIEVLGYVIDPTQHTAVVMGQVPNPDGRLRVGQFVKATVELPPPPGQVALKTTALVEDGRESIVFVQPNPNKPCYTRRQVAVARRTQDMVTLCSRLNPDDERKGLQPLQPGERVVTAGAVELEAALEDLQAAAKQKR